MTNTALANLNIQRVKFAQRTKQNLPNNNLTNLDQFTLNFALKQNHMYIYLFY